MVGKVVAWVRRVLWSVLGAILIIHSPYSLDKSVSVLVHTYIHTYIHTYTRV